MTCIKKIIKEIKGVFVAPKKTYYIGKIKHGTPYFNPMGFNSNILKIKKLELNSKEILNNCKNDYIGEDKKFTNMPIVRRCRHYIFKIFNNYYYFEIGWPIMIHNNELGWKDKYDMPRFEWCSSFQIFFFKWQFCIFWNAPDNNNDLYYEMILWYLHYSDNDIDKARKTWGWTNYKTKKSTWNDNYLIKTL